MDLLNYLIAVVILAVVVQFGEIWLVLGIAGVLIIASRDIKATIMLVITVGLLYYINGIGMKEYWLFAVMGMVALGYILGMGKEEAPADPYAGLLGGGGMGGLM